jgi:HemY protein
VSPVSGRLDAFQWKVPLAELGDKKDVIEADRIRPLAVPAPRRDETSAPRSGPDNKAAESSSAAGGPAQRPAPQPEAVIPLVHAPDDPGPEPALEPDPSPAPPGRQGLFK